MRQGERAEKNAVRLFQAFRQVLDYEVFDKLRIFEANLVQPIEIVPISPNQRAYASPLRRLHDSCWTPIRIQNHVERMGYTWEEL
jgi:hypothetical protein